MKHIRGISATPASANEVQFIICQLSLLLSELLGFKGGSSPLLDFINLQCDLPQAND
ncbi:MAG TPA: hypothetical protein PLO37_01155 [Candidatus Hydrogenedentes bacterium]|nr:hypothetical protein [Candidatus Hydrogenedentota bacterium]HPG65423.1 hypothetical protein [Candidatus Hydrogenedentota bacterium]